jgi:hypothetical protein
VRRGTRTVASTSNNSSGAAVQYADKVIGNRIAHHENYLFMGASFQGATPSLVDPKPIAAVSAGLTFAPYTAGALQVLLTTELADFMMPSDAFLQNTFSGWTLAALQAHIRPLIRNQMKTTLASIFTDAGFGGMASFWSDEAGAAALLAEFRVSFVLPVVGNRTWRLGNSAAPMGAPFWHFYVTGSQRIQSPGEGEEYAIATATPRTFRGTTFLVPMTVPIGSGTKPLTQTIRIDPTHFLEGVTIDRNGQRQYSSMAAFETAINAMATQVAILAAHEIGHGLGLMHLSRVENGTYSEPQGGSVLSIMSQTVEQSAFALDMKFHAQAKQMWKASFGTSPNDGGPDAPQQDVDRQPVRHPVVARQDAAAVAKEPGQHAAHAVARIRQKPAALCQATARASEGHVTLSAAGQEGRASQADAARRTVGEAGGRRVRRQGRLIGVEDVG